MKKSKRNEKKAKKTEKKRKKPKKNRKKVKKSEKSEKIDLNFASLCFASKQKLLYRSEAKILKRKKRKKAKKSEKNKKKRKNRLEFRFALFRFEVKRNI